MAKKKSKKTPFSLLGIIVVALVLFYNSDWKLPPKSNVENLPESCEVIAHYIDVGQGDSAFIELPNGKCMLIDAGENEYGVTVCNYIRKMGKSYIDYVVATHPHSDHVGGMDDVIKEFEIGEFYMPDCTNNTKTFESMVDCLLQKDITAHIAQQGVVIADEGDLKIEIVSPNGDYDDLNNYSAVVKLTYGRVSYLFTGDAETYAENRISADVSAQVLKVGHHGSETSTGARFLKRVNPQVAVISVGKQNEYGHPHSQVVQRLMDHGAQILRTDRDGTVVVATDGKQIYY